MAASVTRRRATPATAVSLDFFNKHLEKSPILLCMMKPLNPQPNPDGDYIVVVALPPSDDLVLTLLAVWKAGAVYLPLDASSPRDRTKHILHESKPLLIITQSGNEGDTAYGNIVALSYDQLKQDSKTLSSSKLSPKEMVPVSREDPIEIILYTSGSTGLSKGVRVKKSSILNRLQWQWYELPYEPSETTFVFKTALTFVDSVSELWGPLLCPIDGPRTLLIVPKEITTNPQRLVNFLHQYEKLLKKLKIWVCSGEPLAASLVKHFFKNFHSGEHVLYNFYGSTEMMGDVTFHEMKTPEDISSGGKVPIGFPVDNTVIYLLNNSLQPVASGEVGELYAAGLNIAAGYVNGRDAERFIQNPFSVDPEYSLLYRTGDYAKIVKGTLLFEGRTDSQVKVRGHRVDLSEVEAAVVKCPEVQKGIVLCYNPGEHDQVIIIEEMPFLVNGKIDRQTLLKQYKNLKGQNVMPKIDLSGLSQAEAVAGECLFRTVAEVLGSSARASITKDANFYELGGNSLNSVLTISLLNEQGYTISVTDFISARNLGEVIARMCISGSSSPSKAHWEKYTLEILEERHKEDAFKIIGDSFYEKADIEKTMDPPVHRQEYIDLLECIWPYLVDHGVSIVVRDSKTQEVVGVSLLMNADKEPTELDLTGQLMYTMDFLDYLEMPIREKVLPPGEKLHSFMLGTSQTKSPQENIEITEYMEEKVFEFARENGYIGILTTNTSPLTQQLADVLNYQKLKIYQINEYVAPDGTRPFKRAPDDQLAIVSWKKA
ncbi:unnamed protein product [Nesidiocoris tenuis]|uniref:Carrier domain-containing protein n=1 Tax=Nesidiocoris tenuis TaxID=355587 RepID=A0A6H5H2K5_9HEMI|nr:unnamed protein product [Nesidiocoris tenuis]